MRRRRNVLDATLQLLEFAEIGRLRTPIETSPTEVPPVSVVVASSTGLGLGMAVVALAATGSNLVMVIMGLGVVATASGALVPALASLREQRRRVQTVRIERADYRSVDALQRGHWINHDNTWVRIDQASHTTRGTRSALLSSGQVIDLREPVLVASGRFEPRSPGHVAP